jgi:hypothetical protein
MKSSYMRRVEELARRVGGEATLTISANTKRGELSPVMAMIQLKYDNGTPTPSVMTFGSQNSPDEALTSMEKRLTQMGK